MSDAFANRKSRMAIVEETTAGTPVAPSAAGQYIALQDGFSLTPNVETIDNEELKASIGTSAPILGLESPSVELSHYIRHSHVEATAPNFGQLLECAFGSVTAAPAQSSTTSGSTAGTSSAAAIVKLASGGSNYPRGSALLIKDGTNGYSIRPVQSQSSNDLTLGFNLAAAPASGIGVGRPILYAPSDTPPSCSVWLYRANEADVELVAGAKVTEMSVEANAGEALNASFSLEGSGYYFDPVEIGADDIYLDFLDNATTRAAVIEAKIYKDPTDLAAAIQSAMNGLGSANTFTCVFNTSGANKGKYTITSNGTTLSLLWNTGTNTANTVGDAIGFSVAADDTGALTYTSDNAASWVSPQTPSIDAGEPLVVKNQEVMIGDFDDYGCSNAQSVTITLSNELQKVPDICEESGVASIINVSRLVEVECVLTLQKHDADKYSRFRQGSDVRFAYNFGTKSGGNWVAGKCGCFYMPAGKISAFEVSDADGIVTINMTIQAYVDSSGNGEFYLNFL